MTLAEYLYSVFWKFVVGYVWYRSLLFRPLAGLERKASLHILLWMTAAAVLALSLGFRRRKNGWISSACVFLPFGLYTVLAYAKTFRTRILLILVPTAVLAMGLTAVMFWGGPFPGKSLPLEVPDGVHGGLGQCLSDRQRRVACVSGRGAVSRRSKSTGIGRG